MPRTCTLCKHPQRDELDRALLAGDSFRHIAAQFDTSTGALQRHKADHLPQTLVKAHDALEVARADAPLDDVLAAEDRAEGLYAAAERILARELRKTEPDANAQLRAIRTATAVMAEKRAYMELLGRLTGELAGPEQGLDDRALRVISVPKIGN